MADKHSDVEHPAERRAKRAYKKPSLIRHGNLREITLAVGNHGNSDNGGNPPNTKTH